jgi:ABC-type dipeptide/oligopeptide/nickel transport system ATPase component
MIENEGKMIYVDQMQMIKESLMKIFDELMKVSHQLIRPESNLRKTEKQFLPEMNFEDESYRNALTEVQPALNKIIIEPFTEVANEFEKDYSSYFTLNPN